MDAPNEIELSGRDDALFELQLKATNSLHKLKDDVSFQMDDQYGPSMNDIVRDAFDRGMQYGIQQEKLRAEDRLNANVAGNIESIAGIATESDLK